VWICNRCGRIPSIQATLLSICPNPPIRGTNRDAESLLKFLNLVCNQNEEELWELPAPGIENAVSNEAGSNNTRVTVMVDPVESRSSTSGLYNGLLAVGIVAILALFAGYIDRSRQIENGTLVVAPPAADGPASESGRQMQKLLADIDSTIGRMVGMLMRLVRARVGLVIAPSDDDASVAVAGGASAIDVAASPSTSSSSRPLPPGTPLAGGGRLGSPTVASAIISPSKSAEADALKPSPSFSSWPEGQLEAAVPNISHHTASSPFPPPPPPSPEKALEMALRMKATASYGSHPRIPADKVLALLDEEDDDVGKVVDRLMKQ